MRFINPPPNRLRPAAAAFVLLGVLALTASPALAETSIEPRGALGPYSWVGDHPGRWNTARFVRFMWFWHPSAFTDLIHEQQLGVTGTPDGELFEYDVEALAEVLETNTELVDPRGMTEFLDGELWIADYGADKIVGYDPSTGVFRTVFESAELDGPIDINCAELSAGSRFWGFPADPTCGQPGMPDCSITGACAIITENNDKLVIIDQDGEFQVSTDVSDPVVVAWVGDTSPSEGTWAAVATSTQVVGYRIISDGDGGWEWFTNLYGITKRNLCRGFNGISAIESVGSGTSEDMLIAQRDSNTVHVCEDTGSWGAWGEVSLVWDETDGLNRPINIARSMPLRHINWDYSSGPWSTSTSTYVLNEDGSIVRFTSASTSSYEEGAGRDPSYRLFSDIPELASARNIEFHDPVRGAYVITSNTSTGDTSLLTFPWYVGVKIEAIGAPADTYIGVGRETPGFNHYLNWMWADASRGHEITFNATREETLSIYAGRGRGVAAADFDLLATETLVPEVAQPATTAAPGNTGGLISLEITHPTDIDELRLYAYSGCESIAYWGSGYMEQVCPEGCDPRRCWDCEWVYRDPSEGAFEVLYSDLFDCFTQIGEITPNPSGTTQYDLSAYPTVPGMEYCFVSMAVDTAQNQFSQPSDIDFLDSCAISPAGSAVGLICSDALTAVSSGDGDIVEMTTGAPGNPTWYSYSVPGPASKEHVIAATINSKIESGGTSMIRVFLDDCPEASDSADAAGERTVGLVANGGDEIFFQLTYFGRRSVNWHIEDLQSAPVSEQLRPTGVTATGGDGGAAEDGQITVCWEPVRQAGFQLTNHDFMHYEVWRGPEGGPTDTLLVDNWQGHCYVDRGLGPGVTHEYEIVAIYPLYDDAPYHQSIDDSAVIRSKHSEFAAGTSSATDMIGTEPTLAAPTGLNVAFPDPNETHFLYPSYMSSWSTVGRAQSNGTRVWWDQAVGPTRHRIVQYDMGTGETSEYVAFDQTHAVDLRMDRLALVCFDVIAERENEDGSVTVSEPAGWSATGDSAYCINMCTDSVVEVTAPGSEYTSWTGETYAAERSFSGPSRNYAITFGVNNSSMTGDEVWFEPHTYSGPYYTASYSGVPTQACAYQGTDSCTDLVFLGCAVSNAQGITRNDFYIPNEEETVFVMWELRPDLFPIGSTNEDFLNFGWVEVEFGMGVSPPDQWRSSTSAPPVSIALDVDSMCASYLTVDYAISNWEPDVDSFVAIIVDDRIAMTLTELSGRSEVPVNPLITLHQVEIALYQNPSDKLRSWYSFQETGSGIGDVNHDCKIDVLDVVIISLDILGLQSIGADLRSLADFNEDMNIDVLDMVAMVASILSDLAG